MKTEEDILKDIVQCEKLRDTIHLTEVQCNTLQKIYVKRLLDLDSSWFGYEIEISRIKKDLLEFKISEGYGGSRCEYYMPISCFTTDDLAIAKTIYKAWKVEQERKANEVADEYNRKCELETLAKLKEKYEKKA